MKITAALLIALACTLSVQALADERELFELIDARLELMDEVAAYKFQHNEPIEDLEREKVVLDASAQSAAVYGLETRSARYFFQLQIEAAKEIQHYWFNRFEESGKSPSAPDLNTEVRPQLIELGDRINAAILDAGKLKLSSQQLFVDTVSVKGLSESTEVALFRALTEIARYPDRLTQVMQTKMLRVGTTGDYAPFSLAKDGSYKGIDIDMARDLARSLGAKVEFIKTSWPTLMTDLTAHRFDIGMSGISKNASRAETAFFSTSYYAGGKTPIARCTDVRTYNSLAAINRPGVRVIVNPGGTNYGYATEHLPDATLIIHDDNTTIFDEIVANRADVMITDAIEVKLKTKQLPQLCATMPGETLTFQEKAYLMPQERTLKDYVDNWLELRMLDGTFRKIYAQHMGVE